MNSPETSGMLGQGAERKVPLVDVGTPARDVPAKRDVRGNRDWVEKQRARADVLWAPGEWDRVARDLEAVLPPEVASVEVVNVGEPEVKGFTWSRSNFEHRRVEVPKKRCDDRKINDPDHGLFAVMDGVSEGHGAIAAEVTSRVVQARMGEELDKELQRLFVSGANERAINAYVAHKIQRTIREADEAVERVQALRPDYRQASTTLSLAKLVEMPDGKHRLYFANIGDSRVYLERSEGQLLQLTEDDSKINSLLKNGSVQLSAMQLRAIDQYVDEHKLPPRLIEFVRMRNVITDAIGFFAPDEYVDTSRIQHTDVKPGQRFLITSDGVHDNSLQWEMQQALKKPDNLSIERQLQADARAIQTDISKADFKGGRGKPDDISAVVGEVVSRREHARLLKEIVRPAPRVERKYNQDDVSDWKDRLHELDQMAARARLTPGQRLERLNLEYWITRASLDDLRDRDIEFTEKHELKPGDQITYPVRRSDGSRERLAFRVTGFAQKAGERMVLLQGKTDRGTIVPLTLPAHEAVEKFIGELEDRLEYTRTLLKKAEGDWSDLQQKIGSGI